MKDKRIAVVGLGGVGGVIGAMLAKQYDQVAFYARGRRLDAILERGLILHSAAYGDITVKPAQASADASALGPMDYLFLCVKNYSLAEVCRQIGPMVTEQTVILPVLNGIAVSEGVRQAQGKGLVVDCLAYVVSGSEEDFSIRHSSPYCNLHIGLAQKNREAEPILLKVQSLLEAARLNCVIEADIQAAIWKKYILNCAYNVVTAYYNASTEEIRANPRAVAQLQVLLAEASHLARLLKVKIPLDLEKTHLEHILHHQAPASTSSLKRDMEAGKPNELEVFSGKLLALAASQGVSLPLTEYFWQELRQRSAN